MLVRNFFLHCEMRHGFIINLQQRFQEPGRVRFARSSSALEVYILLPSLRESTILAQDTLVESGTVPNHGEVLRKFLDIWFE